MDRDTAKLNDPNFCSVIQVDKDVAFVLDNRDVGFSVTNIPAEKTLGMSRKTYSKKHPLTYDSPILIQGNKLNASENSSRKSILKNSPKCSSTSTRIQQKRPLDCDLGIVSRSPVPRKIRRKEISCSMQIPTSTVNGRIIDRNRTEKISNIRVPSPDSDVEILDVIVRSSSKTVKRDSDPFYTKERNKVKMSDIHKKRNTKSLPDVVKPCYSSADDVPITEADIAPNIPSNSVIPDTGVSETNQDSLNSQSRNQWILTTAASVISSVQNGETSSAKKSEMQCSNKQNLLESETKEKRPPPKRELKNLYENLNEMYWSRDKEFQQMININNTDHRHSERITAKASDTGKNLRRLKAKSGNIPPLSLNTKKKLLGNKNSAKLALNKAKYGRPRPTLVLKKGTKDKSSLNRVCKKVVKRPILKPKRGKISARNMKMEPKVVVKAKTDNTLKKKQALVPFTKNVKDIACSKSKVDNSPPNTAKNSFSSALKKIKPDEDQILPKSSTGKYVKKVEYTNEVKFMRKKCIDKDAIIPLKHLERTSLWNSSLCEAFSNYVIEQSSSQMENKSKESIKAMFDELMVSWLQNQPENVKRKKPEEETLRSSVRQSECAFRYKEIVVKKHESYMQFILVPNAVKQNSLSIEAMRELRDAFLLAKKDSNCRAVLLNSSGTFFCTGIDLSQLVGSNKKQAAEEMAATIKDLVLTISTFTKPVVAAVNGIAVGFGVTLLTLCDVVLASDKATFCIPATRLGYLPEGAITLTLPQVVGSTVATELLLYGRRLTADQALRHGLVSEVLWHSNLMNEVIPRVQIIVSQPLQVMEATKTMVRCQLWDRLKFHMEREWRLLPPLWLDAQCQSNIKKALQTGWLFD